MKDLAMLRNLRSPWVNVRRVRPVGLILPTTWPKNSPGSCMISSWDFSTRCFRTRGIPYRGGSESLSLFLNLAMRDTSQCCYSARFTSCSREWMPPRGSDGPTMRDWFQMSNTDWENIDPARSVWLGLFLTAGTFLLLKIRSYLYPWT